MLDVLPLRAIVYQFLFLLVAIAIEGAVFRQFIRLKGKPIAYKTSMQYSATVNLLSTFIGWIVFFAVQPFLPTQLRLQLVSYVFFERFFTNDWLARVAPLLVVTGLGIYIGTVLVELQGLEVLERFLGNKEEPEKVEVEKTGRFRGRRKDTRIQFTRQFFALLIGNALSFSAILLLLIARLASQGRLSTL